MKNMALPQGRIVGGHPMRFDDKDTNGKPLTKKDGTPTVNYWLKVAIAKNDPAWPQVKEAIMSVGREAHPHLFGADGLPLSPMYKDKIEDGDSIVPNSRGKKPCDRDGYPGHWVVSMRSQSAPSVYMRNGSDAVQITDMKLVKTGDYVVAYVAMDNNNSADTPGVAVYLQSVMLTYCGDEISSRPGAEEMYGSSVPAMPQGACAPPSVGAPPPPPQQHQQQAQQPPQQQQAPPPPPPSQEFLGNAAPEMYMVAGMPYERSVLTAQGYSQEQLNALPRA